MSNCLIKRFYPIHDLSFQDFWDICTRFQTTFPEFEAVCYSVDGVESILALEEVRVDRVLKRLQTTQETIRRFSARFYVGREHSHLNGSSFAEFHYDTMRHGSSEIGLRFFSDRLSKPDFYEFEKSIYANREFSTESEILTEFGKPCEVVALVIDIRGFSVFCEKPEIESPYTCGLMSAFYQMVTQALHRYPPEMTKFMGDGVLAIWETEASDRAIIVKEALIAAISLRKKWATIRKSPRFIHGAPRDVGAGICFGLASLLEIGNDYIGRPINIASRLCSVCPGDHVYVDRAVPNLPIEIRKHEYVAHIKPYGRHNIWAYPTKLDQENAPRRLT